MKFNNKKYTYRKPFSSRYHQWEIVGPRGAMHFHVSIMDGNKYDPTCGLEVHHNEPPEYMKDQAPSELKCWLTGGRCWHDGTSLYASETLWPMYKIFLEAGNHEAVFNSLESEYINRFEESSES